MDAVLSESSMERQRRLLAWIEERARVSVSEICTHFAVSPATARRDLEVLAEQGKVQRVHGGAVALHRAPPEPPVIHRGLQKVEEKRRIAAAAAKLVDDGDTIFLGSGTTVLEVAHCLHEQQNLTVFTNSLPVINALSDAPGVTLLVLGGQLRATELSLIGPLTEQALADLRSIKVIMGIHAIDLQAGLTNNYLEESKVDRAILRIASSAILVADHTKCARISTTFVAPIEMMDILVTDTAAPADFVAALRTVGVEVLVV